MRVQRVMLFYWVGTALAAVALFGCAALNPPPGAPVERPSTGVGSDQNGWWRAQYRLNWPQNSDPDWYLDLYIASQIVAPVLDRYRSEIVLWRFHRRAVRDQAGHQFSFIFYSTAVTAGRIYADLQSNPNVQQLKSEGKLLDASYADPARNTQPRIEDGSDSSWSPSIQKSWPYFIMGVSQTWLQLISEIADQASAKSPGASRDPEFYRQVQTAITDLWQTEGRHAFLHHLNALFGYEPVIVYEKRYLQF
jgi:hypothetical protein